jgi:hypothetical protein
MKKTLFAAFVLAALSVTGSAFADGPFSYYALTPCRVADTRNAVGPAGGPALTAGGTRSFQFQGSCGVPVGAKAVTVNVTITGAGGAPNSHLRLWPQGTAIPTVSTINFTPQDSALANGAIVGLSAATSGGDLSVFNAAGSVHVILDVTGYFQ